MLTLLLSGDGLRLFSMIPYGFTLDETFSIELFDTMRIQKHGLYYPTTLVIAVGITYKSLSNFVEICFHCTTTIQAKVVAIQAFKNHIPAL